jgi:hypothetical protein
MSHFAELDENNIVLRVLVGDNNLPNEGYDWFVENLGGTWVQTSYNGTIRRNFAGIGYTYDEELDDDSKIKHVKIARKKAIAEAKKHFNSQKEKYKLPLESSGMGLSPEEKEEFEAYRQYTKQSKSIEEESNRKRRWFDQKTEEVFSKDFKGFEFDINEKKILFAPASGSELKSAQSSPLNFVNKFLDDSGLIKDAAGYHKSLSIAMNPEKFAKFFYEQGQADATVDVLRKTKNINMSERRAPEVVNKGGMQVKAVAPDSGRSLKIRSIKKM